MNFIHYSSLILVIALALLHQANSELSAGCKRFRSLINQERTKCQGFDSAEFQHLTEVCPPPIRTPGYKDRPSYCVPVGTCPKGSTEAEIVAQVAKTITDVCPSQKMQEKKGNFIGK